VQQNRRAAVDTGTNTMRSIIVECNSAGQLAAEAAPSQCDEEAL